MLTIITDIEALKMNKEAKELARQVLTWWEDAQYWECHGHNIFDDEPNFVTKAKKILPDSYKDLLDE
tara:strand:+ start:1551 stop:1751 length:201 start_codon:yes stop_codon:yes gene_type:complete